MGVAHIVSTKAVVTDFGAISEDNKRIITMESIAEGLTLCFLGVIGLLITILGDPESGVSRTVLWASGVMLLVMAMLTTMTGARTSILPYKICPAVKTIVAILFFLGSVL